MKKLFLIALAFYFSIAATAQNNTIEPAEYANQLSINATLFIKQFLSINNNIAVINSPYLLTYKHLVNGAGLRTGIGLNMNSTKQNPNNGLTTSQSSFVNLDFRIGLEKQEQLNKHWLFYYGADALYNYDLTRTKTSSISGFPPQPTDITAETEAFSTGVGPVLGVEFKLGKRISLNTETTAYFNYTESRRRVTNPNFGTFNTNEFTAINRLDFIIPTSIFFVFHF